MKNNSRTYNSVRNIIWGFFSKIVILVLTFVGRAVFIQILGIELLGVNSLFTNILNVLSLAELGFGAAMSYSFYKPLAEHDTDKLAALTQFYKRVYTLIAVAVAVIGVSLLPFLELIVKVDKPIPYLRLYYLLFLANAVGSYICVYKTSILNADQKNYLINAYTMWITFFRVILQIVTLIIFKNFVIYLVIMIICTVLTNVLASIKVDEEYPYIKEKKILSKEDKSGIYSIVGSIFVYNVSSTLLDCIDSILISAILGTVIVGYYTNYSTVINSVLAFVIIIFTAITASVGNLSVSEEPKKRYEVYKIMNMVGFGISGICVTCFYTLLNDFVELWIGKQYVLEQSVLIAFMAAIYIFCSFRATIAFREAVGLYSKIKYIVLLAAIINAILSIIFGKWFGLCGIIIATSISRLITIFWYEPMVLHRDYFEEKPKAYYLVQIINIFLVVICMITASHTIKCFDFNNTWITLIYKALISVGVVTIIYLLRYFRTNEFKEVIKKLR